MTLGPCLKHELTATCNQCGFSRSKTEEIDPINVTNAKMRYVGEVAKSHGQHSDLQYWDVTAKEV